MATIKILFDTDHRPVEPTLILANRSGNRLGQLHNVSDIFISDSLNDSAELTFKVSEFDHSGTQTYLWDKLVDFKLLYCPEWDTWFEINVELTDGQQITKSVTARGLCESELSQILLFGTEINTEDDIARDDYTRPTILYDRDHPEASLLDRITEKAPHYKIAHVDETLAGEQRSFSFDNISIKDALDEIAEELHALVVYGNENCPDMNGPARTISFYDLEQTCQSCHHRGEFADTCPKCGSSDIRSGYGRDTTIFVTKDNLTNEISFTSDADSVKNCFRLEAGDDLMTDTVRSCNSNGSSYIWYVSESAKEDMPDELVQKIEAYESESLFYEKEYTAEISSEILGNYNALIEKYKHYRSSLRGITPPVVGYPALIDILYETIDFAGYLQDSLMPDVSMSDTTAREQAALLTVENLSPVAVSNLSAISAATADSNVLSVAKIMIDHRYQVKIKESSFDKTTLTWNGSFTVTNYSDNTDAADSARISITISDDYAQFVRQKIDRALHKGDTEDYSISGLFQKEITENDGGFEGSFVDALKQYSLSMLTSIHDCCQGCIDVLKELGMNSQTELRLIDPDLSESFFLNYCSRLQAIELEMAVREQELLTIQTLYDAVKQEQLLIQKTLDFEQYLGSTLWNAFCSYRRDDVYSNKNYCSDGQSNAELLQKAAEFIKNAKKEIYKSATLQHSISSTLKNLLALKKFERIVDYFQVGNWIRILVDGTVYKLRLLHYEIDYGSLETIHVDFSDVTRIKTGISDVQSILKQSSSMFSSYHYVERQASNGNHVYDTINSWTRDGLDATKTRIVNNADSQDIVFDQSGLLLRRYNEVTKSYDPTQMKIINSTIAITKDNWNTVQTAIGNMVYRNPETKELSETYGINAEVLMGRMILGENLGIYNTSGSLKFDKDGLLVSNGTNLFQVNPNNEDSIVKVSKGSTNIFSLNADGDLELTGKVTATSGHIGGENGLEIGSACIRNGGISSAVNTTIPGVYIGTDGFNVSGGTPATTSYFTKSGINIGGKLVWRDGLLSVDGKITASSGTIGDFNIYADSLSTPYCGMSGGTYATSFEDTEQLLYPGTRSSDLSTYDHWVFWAGNGNFKVNRDGHVWMKKSYIKQDLNMYVNDGDESRIALKSSINTYSGFYILNIGSEFEQILVDHTLIISDSASIRNGLLVAGNSEFNNDVLFDAAVTCSGNVSVNGNLSFHNTYGIRSDNNWVIRQYTTSADDTTVCIGCGNAFQPLRLFTTNSRVWLHNSTTTYFSTTSSSDKRLKKDFSSITENYEKMYMDTEVFSFRYILDDDKIHYGFMAQDVMENLARYGIPSDNHLYSSSKAENFEKNIINDDTVYLVNYMEWIPLNKHMITKTIKRVEQLEERLTKLEERALA